MNTFRVNFTDGSKQAAMAIKPKITEKILKHSIQQRSLATVKCVLVFIGKLWAIVIDSIHFDEVVVEIALRSVLQVFVNVVG